MSLPRALLLRRLQQRVGRRAGLVRSAGHRSVDDVTAASQSVERQVELQHVDARLADQAEQAAFDVIALTSSRTFASGRPRALATRGTWNSAAAGEMSGSRPLAEVVTRSTGTARAGILGLELVDVALHALDQRLRRSGRHCCRDELAAL